MRRFLCFLSMAIWMVVIATSCNNENVANQQTVTPTSTVTVPVTAIGWGALSSAQRAEILEIDKAHPFGGEIKLNPPMLELVSVTKIVDVPSPECQNQTLVEYRYSDGVQTGTNKILIQGHFENVMNVESIPDLLNNKSCCFLYGGCIQEYKCDKALPESNGCVPCEKSKPKKEECKPCKNASKNQGDGVTGTVDADGQNYERKNIEF